MQTSKKHPLDEIPTIQVHDPMDMYNKTKNLPDECKVAFDMGRLDAPNWEKSDGPISLCGMGGSAIGGDLTKAIFEQQSSTPFYVHKDYGVPNFVKKDSVVFISSYSGYTEETLSAYREAKERNAKIIAISSGGPLQKMAKQDGFPHIKVYNHLPPRTAIAYLFLPVLAACHKMGYIPDPKVEQAIAVLNSLRDRYSVENPLSKNFAKELASKLYQKLPIIYGLGSWQAAVAWRWKAQINENSKNMCFVHAYPELNHNELLGWSHSKEQGIKNFINIVLEDGSETPRMKKRAEVTENLIKDFTESIHICAEGEDLLSKMMSLIYTGDMASIYLAALNKVDPENIDWINILKKELTTVP